MREAAQRSDGLALRHEPGILGVLGFKGLGAIRFTDCWGLCMFFLAVSTGFRHAVSGVRHVRFAVDQV